MTGSVDWTLLPSLDTVAKAISGILISGCSVLWLFSSGSPKDYLVSRAMNHCEDAGLYTCRATVAGVMEKPGAPSELLLQSSGPQREHPLMTLGKTRVGEHADVYVINGLDQMPSDKREGWAKALSRWAHGLCSEKQPRDGASPVLLIPTTAPAPVSFASDEVLLRVERYWGCISHADLRAFADVLGHGLQQQRSVLLWADCVFPELAAYDPALLLALYESRPSGIQKAYSVLIDYGVGLGWKPEVLTGCLRGGSDLPLPRIRQDKPIEPPTWAVRLWEMGAADWTPERAIEVHSSALALIGRYDELAHRVWRGEAGLLLPLLDMARVRLCRYLTRRHGTSWFIEVAGNGATPPEPSGGKDWGALVLVFREYCKRGIEYAPLTSAVGALKGVRNMIAHCEPLDMGQFTSAVEALDCLAYRT